MDFECVTNAWVRLGFHSTDEVAQWKEWIRTDMHSEKGADPINDPRPRVERIDAWCKTFAKLAKQIGGEK